MPRAVKFTINLNVNGKNVIAEASTTSKELAVNLGIAEEKGNKLRVMPQTGGHVDVRVRIKERDLYGVSQKSNRYKRMG